MNLFLLRQSLLLFVVLCLNIVTVQAQIGWEVTGYPGKPPISAPITQVLKDPAGRIMGVAGSGPQLTLTTDNGRHWSFLDLPFSDVNGLEFLNGKFYLSTASHGVHRSALLTNWEAVPLPNGTTDLLSFDGNRGFFEIVTKQDRRIYSLDGSTYHVVPDSLGKASESAMTFRGKDEILYVSALGYWSSVAGSNSWTRIGNGVKSTAATVIRDSIYLATFVNQFIPFVMMSKLGGPLDFDTMQVEGGLQFQMMHTVDDTVLLALRKGELHHSFNRVQLSPPLARSGLNFVDLSIASGNDYIVSDELTGLAISDDYSNSWTKFSKRLEANIATELISLPNNILYAVSNQGYVMRSEDGAATWTMKADLFDTITLLAWTKPNTLWIGQPGKLLASTDNGETFVGFDNGFSRRTPSSMIVGQNGKIYLGTDSGMFFSTNEGATWFIPKSFLMNILTGRNRLPPVLSMAIDSSNRLYVGTDQGVILSLDEGAEYAGGWLRNSPIYALQAAPDGRVYAGSHSVRADDTLRENFYTVIHPLDTGVFWYTPNTEMNQWEMNVLDLNSKHQLIAGLLFTWKGGSEWEISGLEDISQPTPIIAQTIDENDVVYISYYDKVYRSAAPKVSTVRQNAKAPELSLYPNPVSDVLHVDSENGGTIHILNMLGEEVLTTRVAETDQISLAHLPSGVYFCQLATHYGTISRPVVISR